MSEVEAAARILALPRTLREALYVAAQNSGLDNGELDLAFSAERVQAERIARRFHEAYERLAPEHGYKTREASAVPWPDVPEDNRSLMIAVVDELLSNGVISA